MNTVPCKSCNAPVIWTQTEKGKRMPVNADPADVGVFRLEETGEVDEKDRPMPPLSIWVGRNGDGERYVSHFETCTSPRPISSTPGTPGSAKDRLQQILLLAQSIIKDIEAKQAVKP